MARNSARLVDKQIDLEAFSQINTRQEKVLEGDAELDGGQEFVEPLMEMTNEPGSRAALGDKLLDASLAPGNRGTGKRRSAISV